MKNIRELLRDADPLGDEPKLPWDQLSSRRQAILAAASSARAASAVESRSRMAVFTTVALMVIAILLVGSRVWPVFVGDVQAAAVHFEIRLAEDRPGPGLNEVKAAGSGRSIYLHHEAIVTNSDIAAARVVQGDRPSEYYVGIEFNTAGAKKMRAATGSHIGRLMAVLLDGQVVMAPVLRTSIGASARISGNFTRAQAQRIVKGIAIQ
ncbi:MAG: hypothetical protein JOZ32_05385 [Bryobacterales bacterium]|nr:hypothetical protein [Bryobacterales bacterium]